MLNRRHLRIKVLQALYAYSQTEGGDYVKAEKQLFEAIDRIYDLYVYLLLSFEEVKRQASRRMEDNKKKIMPKEEDLNPNMKFVENLLITQLEESKELRKLSEQLKVNWVGDENQEMFRKMFLHIRDSETYFEFMNNEAQGYEEDRAFLINLFKVEIANFPLLYNYFEEKSIHWMDDIDLACSMVIKTLKGMEENQPLEILPLYKDEEDEKEFVKNLFRETVRRDKENEVLIDELTSNWELDRIARMDVLLMKLAITEFQIFNNIPTKVTLNEYIEIAKFYSTPKSNGFINGVLDKALVKLNDSGSIKKIGRGLKN
ncbi:MAG: transcription antitermination factor NusB [Bacteroidetes bacterium]|nr:MAG: transcription antitermination factor NusB [Bacteroidota bacterium]